MARTHELPSKRMAEPLLDTPRANLAVICAIFFCSGIPALIYQLVWQRSLFTIYGINVESVTVVVTAFMLGLGLGSFAGGRLSRLRLPLLAVFGTIEICIGVFGYFSLGLFHAVGQLTLQMSAPLTALFTFLLVLVPTLLMGATLPLLTTHLVKHSGNVGRSVGLLYFVNTLGSAFACFIAAAFLMRLLGQQGAVAFACGINVLVGIGAFLAQRNSPDADTRHGERQTAQFNTRGFWFALLLSALCGYIALSYEIVWYRVYSFSSGGVAQAFALVLGCYLLGIALGSLASRRFCRESAGAEQVASLSGFVLFANLASFLLVPAAAVLTAALHWGLSLPLVVIAAGLLGATFPLICHIAIAPTTRAGEGLSYLYLANIVGSALGSLVTGFVLMDHWTLGGISTFLALLGVALSLVLLLAANQRVGKRLLTGRAAALAATGMAIVLAQPFLFGGVYERLYFKNDYAGQRFAHVAENKSGVVSVTQDGEIQGGGVYDGDFSTDLVNDRNMIVRAYALSLLHGSPRDVLMIGLSSGSWAQVIANHPQVEKLTVVEINPSYLDVMKNYPGEAGVLTNPKVDIVIDDGRRWLGRNPDRTFDVIVQNTSFNWRAHATDLLSSEYLDLTRRHLKPGGISFYNTTGSAAAQRTGAVEFPGALRFINFMAVSDSPIELDRSRWERVLREYRIEGKPVFDLSDVQQEARLQEVLALADSLSAGYGPDKPVGKNLETREGILARTEGAPTITDDNMTTEWGGSR